MPAFPLNNDLSPSPEPFQIAATTATDLTVLRPGTPCCRAIEMLASGTLQYTTPAGAVKTFTGLPAKTYLFQAQAIGAATSVSVLVYF